MARKKNDVAPENAQAAEGAPSGGPGPIVSPAAAAAAPSGTPAAAPAVNAGGNGKAAPPVFKVGPIPTDANNSVEAVVWGKEVKGRDGHVYMTYDIADYSYWRDSDGNWKPKRSYHSSQVPVLIYCLQRCWEWVQEQRDPQNAPF
jgi:hypothetical protein